MRDLRYAIRGLIRTPGFTATAVLILALSVGALTAVFSLLHALVLRPLPVPEPHRLVELVTHDAAGYEAGLSWGQFRHFSEHQRSFSAVIATISQGVFTIETATATFNGSVTGASGTYFEELGARPTAGRLLQPSDMNLASATAEPVVVLSWTFWQRHFHGDPAIVGRSLKIQGVPLTIVGVAPPGFLGLGITIEPDVTIPLPLVPRISEAEELFTSASPWISVTGRLAPGVTLDAARAQLTGMWPATLAEATPASLTAAQRDAYLAKPLTVRSGAYGEERGLRARYATPLYVLLAIACLMLAIAATNLCALVFARAQARRYEVAVRLALGARRSRILREAAGEGMLLGTAGAIGGLLFAAAVAPTVADVLLQDYSVRTAFDAAPDAVVGALAGLASAAVAMAVTIAAAWVTSRPSEATLTARGARTISRASRTGRILVGAQVAMAIVLLGHASLLVRSLQNIVSAPTGMTSERLLLAFPGQRVGAYRDLNLETYYRQALDRVRSIPSVSGAAFVLQRLEGGARPPTPIGRAGTPPSRDDVTAETSQVSPGFFATMGLTILEGRDFTYTDTIENQKVAVISRQLARRLFGEGRGVGERLRISLRPDSQNVEVVGIVSDARVFDVRGGNLAIAYTPALQMGSQAAFKFLIVRTPGGAVEIQNAIESLGVETVPRWQTLDYIRGRTLLQERMMAAFGGYFGVLALVLVSAGIYGLLSYVLSLRRKEIGIRMALGATPRHIAGQMAGTVTVVIGLGLAAGLIATALTTPILRGVLVGASPYDPVAIGGAATLLLLGGLLAASVPALRAARVEPVEELRRE